MATQTITFPKQLNISVQPTDILYATLSTANQSYDNSPPGGTKYPYITLTKNHYIFFSKDRRVSTSGILGYYALAEYRNHSKKEAEIFATATEYAPSSK